MTDLIPVTVEHLGAKWPLWRQSADSKEPLAKDLDVAQWLGFARPRKIRELITRYGVELGEVSPHRGAKPSSLGGRPEEGYLLTEPQALFLAAKSETPKATQVLKAMIAVFLRARDLLAPRPAPALPEPAQYRAEWIAAVEDAFATREGEPLIEGWREVWEGAKRAGRVGRVDLMRQLAGMSYINFRHSWLAVGLPAWPLGMSRDATGPAPRMPRDTRSMAAPRASLEAMVQEVVRAELARAAVPGLGLFTDGNLWRYLGVSERTWRRMVKRDPGLLALAISVPLPDLKRPLRRWDPLKVAAYLRAGRGAA